MLFTAWYDDVLVDVNGCEPALALKHIRQAAIDFCDKSNVLVKDLAGITTVALTATYTITSTTGYDIVQIDTIYANGIEITCKSRDELKALYGDITQAFGTEKYYYQEENNTVTLCPIPSAAGTLAIKSALKPTRVATEIEEWVAVKYFDAIAHGAKARLFEIPNKPWSNPQLSGFHSGKFEGEVSKARRNTATGMARGPSRTKLWK